MPDNKRQHYVPRYALEYFACDQEKRRINLVNLQRGKIIRGASLRDQCYKDHFYGKKSDVEKALCHLEGRFASLTSRIVNSATLDKRDIGTITLMVALQRARTLRAAEEINAMMNKMMKLMMFNRVSERDLRKIQVTFAGTAHRSVAQAIALSPMMLDLDQFLLLNQTDVPFVISDNPVIFTNWFCRVRFPINGLCGLARSGLQVVMPLTPWHALLLHDRYVYTAKDRDRVITIERQVDVDQLNALQSMNAFKNVYFLPGLDEARTAQLLNVPRNEDDMVRFKRLEQVGSDELFKATDKDEYAAPAKDVRRELVQVGMRELPKDIRLQKIGVSAQPRYLNDGSAASPMRDAAWCKIVEDFATLVQENHISFAFLGDFAKRHPEFWRVKPAMKRVLE